MIFLEFHLINTERFSKTLDTTKSRKQTCTMYTITNMRIAAVSRVLVHADHPYDVISRVLVRPVRRLPFRRNAVLSRLNAFLDLSCIFYYFLNLFVQFFQLLGYLLQIRIFESLMIFIYIVYKV